MRKSRGKTGAILERGQSLPACSRKWFDSPCVRDEYIEQQSNRIPNPEPIRFFCPISQWLALVPLPRINTCLSFLSNTTLYGNIRSVFGRYHYSCTNGPYISVRNLYRPKYKHRWNQVLSVQKVLMCSSLVATADIDNATSATINPRCLFYGCICLYTSMYTVQTRKILQSVLPVKLTHVFEEMVAAPCARDEGDERATTAGCLIAFWLAYGHETEGTDA